MYVLDVIPFAKNVHKESLAYFTTKDVPLGSIVTIDVRKREVQGLVIGKRSVSAEKSELKSSDFSLRKIKKVYPKFPFQPTLLEAVKDTAQYFAIGEGEILQTLIPSSILQALPTLAKPHEIKKKSGATQERYVVQNDDVNRYLDYRSIIRNSFAQNTSVLFLCPTLEDTRRAFQSLSKGIESNSFVLHSKQGAKKQVEVWQEVLELDKPVLIICTASFLSIPRHDIGTIILEKEGSRAYRTQKRPYLDLKYIAERYAKHIKARFIVGDSVLTAVTLHRFDQDEFFEYSPLTLRFLNASNIKIISMKGLHKGVNDMLILSQELCELIEKNKKRSEHLFIFAARKGLASSIVCQDCGKLVTCTQCSSPMVLYGKSAIKKGNYFRCHVCSAERDAGETCSYCGSWRLQEFGVTVDRVKKQIQSEWSDQKIFVLDSLNATTPIQARKIIEEFYATPGSILIGTEMALLYLSEPIENAAVASIDSLFSIPNFDMRERIIRILLSMRAKASDIFLIQTRKADEDIFSYIQNGNIADFFRQEFILRKKLKYPPFTILIKISASGGKAELEELFAQVAEYLKPHEMAIFPAFTEMVRGTFVYNGVIRLPRAAWIDESLRDKLKKLSPQFSIIVDATSLL